MLLPLFPLPSYGQWSQRNEGDGAADDNGDNGDGATDDDDDEDGNGNGATDDDVDGDCATDDDMTTMAMTATTALRCRDTGNACRLRRRR